MSGLGRFEGAHWSLIEKLKPHHDEAARALPDHSEHQYVPTRLLGKQGTIGQQARRCREAIAVECGRKDVAVPIGEPLVQSKKHYGCRIDPEVRFVDDLTELFD